MLVALWGRWVDALAEVLAMQYLQGYTHRMLFQIFSSMERVLFLYP